MTSRRRPLSQYVVGALAALTLVGYYSYVPTTPLRCASLAGADDVLLVMKTGATEAHRKLPVHLITTFRCIPHYVIYSDLRESINGHVVDDILASASPSLRDSHPDFELHRQLHAAAQSGDGSALRQVEERPLRDEAWRLDRWKFFNMMVQALAARPQSKWFLFIEADTHLVWSTALQYLSRFDASERHYLGSLHFWGGQSFQHGGAGFMVSRPALEALVKTIQADPGKFEIKITEFDAGDVSLGRAFEELGIDAVEAYPSFQGDTPATMEYIDKFWCRPAATYHHVDDSDVVEMWRFEQDWVENSLSGQPFTHRDVYKSIIEPKIMSASPGTGLSDWDNMSGESCGDTLNTEACLQGCQAQPECLQWKFDERTRSCCMGKSIRYGQKEEGARSGWLAERVLLRAEEMGHCEELDWP